MSIFSLLGISRERLDLLMMIKTDGLIYDDRLRKECVSIRKYKSIEISCVERGMNLSKQEVVYGGVSAKSHRIYSRKIFRPGAGIAVKAIEVIFWMVVDIFRSRPRVVWIHNPDMVGLVVISLLLKKVKYIDKIVWDHHELPTNLNSRINRLLLKITLSSVDAYISTNPYRDEFLRDVLCLTPRKVIYIENYPDRLMRDSDVEKLPDNVIEWLDGGDFVLAQGGGRPDRYHKELVEACSRVSVKLIIIGSTHDDKIRSEYVYYTGQIPQMEIIPYTDACIASIILYENESPNTRYCSPNRLFQAVSRGKPVVVGNNPPMKKLVDNTKIGLSLESDGRDVDDIVMGLNNLLLNIAEFTNKACEFRNEFVWENQEEKLLSAIQ